MNLLAFIETLLITAMGVATIVSAYNFARTQNIRRGCIIANAMANSVGGSVTMPPYRKTVIRVQHRFRPYSTFYCQDSNEYSTHWAFPEITPIIIEYSVKDNRGEPRIDKPIVVNIKTPRIVVHC